MHFPCSVDHDIAQLDRWHESDDRANEAEARAIAEAHEALKADILQTIATGTMDSPVRAASQFGEAITITLDMAVFEALASEKAQPLVLALLRTDAAKAVREFIAGEHARTYGDALGLVDAGGVL